MCCTATELLRAEQMCGVSPNAVGVTSACLSVLAALGSKRRAKQSGWGNA